MITFQPLQRTTPVVAPPHHLPYLETREWIHLENGMSQMLVFMSLVPSMYHKSTSADSIYDAELALTEHFQNNILIHVAIGSAAWNARAEWFLLYGPTSWHGRNHHFTSWQSFANGIRRFYTRLSDLRHLHDCISYELRQQRSRFAQRTAQTQADANQQIKDLEDEVAALKQQLEEASQRLNKQ